LPLKNGKCFLLLPLKNGKTLVFFDEIQACVPAISSLRFFYEKLPELHIIAAGSLLEFALAEIPSFGVGRVRSIFVYPLGFDDFDAVNKGAIAEQYCGLELLKAERLYYWHREALNSNAEVDYLAQKGQDIIPVEVKSGKKGSMQSLHLFL
jgi:predicted AAA+ superfamily ATPase